MKTTSVQLTETQLADLAALAAAAEISVATIVRDAVTAEIKHLKKQQAKKSTATV